jgi:hypothetical protein
MLELPIMDTEEETSAWGGSPGTARCFACHAGTGFAGAARFTRPCGAVVVLKGSLAHLRSIRWASIHRCKKLMPLDPTVFEKHYRISELARIWGLGRETTRKLVMLEPGVIRVRLGRKKSNATYSVPASIAERIHTKLLNG